MPFSVQTSDSNFECILGEQNLNALIWKKNQKVFYGHFVVEVDSLQIHLILK